MRKVGVADRALVIRLLKGAMRRFPDYLGVWCVFEQDAFDGGDEKFVGKVAHDRSGRFAPRWSRVGGGLQLGCSQGHDSPSLGGWYFLARNSRQEVVYGPYDEELLTGLPILCLSRVAPILEGERFIGAVGVDVSLDAIMQANLDTRSRLRSPAEITLERWHVFLGETGEIQSASPAARRLLAEYVGPCRHLRMPRVIDRWMAALDADSGATSLATRTGTLGVCAFRHPHTRQRIVSLELKHPRRGSPVPGSSLSSRETEVLEWVEQGKSNGEIALILGISEHTVRHHLERIFAKLGVENRRAAMLSMQSQGRSDSPRFLSHTPG